jgi:uncharacterized protein YegP (UPF0339 family)
MKLEVFKSDGWDNQRWRWRVIARNGKIVAASSEGFASRSGAKRNLRSTLRHLVRLVDEYAA